MRPEGFEPPTFGSGIRRAAVAPWPLSLSLSIYIYILYIYLFRIRDSNPGRQGENLVS
jgi:hypothetical protein